MLFIGGQLNTVATLVNGFSWNSFSKCLRKNITVDEKKAGKRAQNIYNNIMFSFSYVQ